MIVKHANLHVSRLEAVVVQVPLGTMQDMFRNQHGDHVLDGFIDDGKDVVVEIEIIIRLLAC